MSLGWKVQRLKSSSNNVITIVDNIFWPMRSKHGNTDGRRVRTAKGTMFKNKPHLVTFHESILVSLWTFLPTLICDLSIIFLINAHHLGISAGGCRTPIPWKIPIWLFIPNQIHESRGSIVYIKCILST